MKLTLEIELHDQFARAVASKLGMNLGIEEFSEDTESEEPMVEYREATNKEVDSFLEAHMKNTMTEIYSKTVEETKLAQLDEMRAKQEEAIKKEVGGAISVGSKVKKSSK